jgi:GAF domain-containing protein
MNEALAEALRSLARFLVAESSLGDSLHEVAEIAVTALPGAAFAGIIMLDERERVSTGVFTDRESPEIDQAQYDSGRGPCLDAWRHQRTYRLDDLATAEGSYPEFVAACAAHGIHSTLSLPLVAGGTGVGALNLYSRHRNGFTAGDEELGVDLATAASGVVANAAAYWSAYELGQQMNEAMQSRAVIEQAKGILMARSPSLGPDGAFDLLRKASQRENVKLRDIAQRIVDRRTGGEDAPPAP